MHTAMACCSTHPADGRKLTATLVLELPNTPTDIVQESISRCCSPKVLLTHPNSDTNWAQGTLAHSHTTPCQLLCSMTRYCNAEYVQHGMSTGTLMCLQAGCHQNDKRSLSTVWHWRYPGYAGCLERISNRWCRNIDLSLECLNPAMILIRCR